MVTNRANALLCATTALFVLLIAKAPASAQDAVVSNARPSAATVLDSIFTPTQATAGKAVFETVCTQCHSLFEFTAGRHKPLTKFSNVGDMFETISTLMPQSDPGGLSTEEYTAVVSYILQENGYPGGRSSLSAKVGDLIGIRIVEAKPPPPSR